MKYNNLTSLSALGTFDPIFGPLIHNFVTEKQNQVNNENSVNFKNSEKKTEGKGGNCLEKRQCFFMR